MIDSQSCTQGCNISDVDFVVQWKLPGSISTFIQRAGRCAHGQGRVGMAVLLAEPSAYSTVLNEHGTKPATAKSAKGVKKGTKVNGKARPTPTQETKAKKDYAICRGGKRGSADGNHDAILVRDCTPIDEEAADEGLLSLVQAGTCRRMILAKIYNNAILSEVSSSRTPHRDRSHDSSH
jgi:superfamily II DNA/RNA helicase